MKPPKCHACLSGHLTHITGTMFWECSNCDFQTVTFQPGPQMRAAASKADILIYGGEAGGGKSFGLLLDLARYINVPGYSGIYFRRQTTEISGTGGIWEESRKLYPALGGTPREDKMMWRFKTGGADASIQFRHLQYVDTVQEHRSFQYARVAMDELTTFEESQFWYMRSRNRSMCSAPSRCRTSTNPRKDSFVRGLVDWWIGEDGFPIPERDGVLRYFLRDDTDELIWGNSPDEVLRRAPSRYTAEDVQTLTFIRSRLSDNRILTTVDPGYERILKGLPSIERRALGEGNWNVSPAAGDYFKAHWFPIVDAAPADVTKRVRAWDFAATEPSQDNPDPDWTVGVRMAIKDKIVYIEDCIMIRERPLGVEYAVTRTATRDPKSTVVCLWQDPAQAGKDQIERYRRKLLGFRHETKVAKQSKFEYALPVSAAAEAENIRLVKGPWNEAYLAAMEAFSDKSGVKKDVTDATSLGFLSLSQDHVEMLRRLTKWVKQR